MNGMVISTDFSRFHHSAFVLDGWDAHRIDVSFPTFSHVAGNVISDPNPAERKTPVGDGRVARVLLDPAQYHQVGWKNRWKNHEKPHIFGDDRDDPRWVSLKIG